MKRIPLVISAVLCFFSSLWASAARGAEKAPPKAPAGDASKVRDGQKAGKLQPGGPLVNKARARASGDPHVQEEPPAVKAKR